MEVRSLVLFTAILFAASLANPSASPIEAQWLALQRQGSTQRYWLMPEFAVAVAFVWLSAYAPNRLARAVSTALVCVMLIVDVACWRLPALPDMYFDTYVAAFKALPPGRRSKSQSIRRVGHFKLTKKQRE